MVLNPLLQRVYQRAAAEQQNIREAGVTITKATGRLLIYQPGEVIVPISFPTYFTERPTFTYGWEYDTDYLPVSQNFGGGWAAVSKWSVVNASQGFDGYFTGAEIAVKCVGTSEQQMWLHWSMEGKALQNPVNP
jgi:hypothetical protein